MYKATSKDGCGCLIIFILRLSVFGRPFLLRNLKGFEVKGYGTGFVMRRRTVDEPWPLDIGGKSKIRTMKGRQHIALTLKSTNQ